MLVNAVRNAHFRYGRPGGFSSVCLRFLTGGIGCYFPASGSARGQLSRLLWARQTKDQAVNGYQQKADSTQIRERENNLEKGQCWTPFVCACCIPKLNVVTASTVHDLWGGTPATPGLPPSFDVLARTGMGGEEQNSKHAEHQPTWHACATVTSAPPIVISILEDDRDLRVALPLRRISPRLPSSPPHELRRRRPTARHRR